MWILLIPPGHVQKSLTCLNIFENKGMIIIIIDAMIKRKKMHGNRDIFLTDILIRKIVIERILRRRENVF